jgi:hypothetical protein
MTVLLWVVQVLLALVFLFAGGMKLVLPIEERPRRYRCRDFLCGSSAWPKCSGRSA